MRAIEWLDKRFPPKVTVTDEMFAAMQDREHRHSKEIANMSGELMVLRDRCLILEKAMAALKDGIAKGQVPLNASEKAALRDSFVKGNWESPA